MQMRNNRDLLVLATKFTMGYKNHEYGVGKAINHSGKSRVCSLPYQGQECADSFYEALDADERSR